MIDSAPTWAARSGRLAAALVSAAATAAADAHPILDIDGRPAERAVVTATPAPPPALPRDLADAPMARALAGIIGELDRSEMHALHLAVPLNPGPLSGVTIDHRIAVLHLERGATRKRVDLVRAMDGRLLLRSLDEALADGAGDAVAPPEHVEVRSGRLLDIARRWSAYRGGFGAGDAADVERGVVFEMEQPYASGWFVLGEDVLRERMYRGPAFKRMDLTPQARELSDESLLLRVPPGYDPRRPAGLVVWIDPTPGGAPPREFDEALDELGFLCVGAAGAGNDRPVHDRFQLAFDAIATVQERFHIDPERIYVTGMSGGGRCASMLWGCFPDVFAGAIPIVGMHSYNTVRVPAAANKIWPRAYAKPKSELLRLLRDRRLAPMTGPPDFNHDNTIAHVKALDRDGMDVRAFVYDDMSHVMPEPERFAEALRWVDEPRRTSLAEAEARAERFLGRAMERFGGGAVEEPSHRRLLVEAVASAPWSDAAWAAWEQLGGAGAWE